MAKRDKYIKQRSKFCQLALKDSKKAASQLRDLATGLENCRNTSDVVSALCEIFAVSERTVFNDLIR
jgi:hypothetical protein